MALPASVFVFQTSSYRPHSLPSPVLLISIDVAVASSRPVNLSSAARVVAALSMSLTRFWSSYFGSPSSRTCPLSAYASIPLVETLAAWTRRTSSCLASSRGLILSGAASGGSSPSMFGGWGLTFSGCWTSPTFPTLPTLFGMLPPSWMKPLCQLMVKSPAEVEKRSCVSLPSLHAGV